ncbi:MAG: nitroreductase family protein [Chloroflexi bacterium]|nr:nitroreductase family protein [Chloroflexota bacterium]
MSAPNLTPQDLHDWLRSRRSVRRFRPDPVPAETITRILETATWAPNAHNRQPWRFVQLASRESREALAGAMGAEFQKTLTADGLTAEEISVQLARSRARILEAPEAILLCLDIDVLDKYEDPARTQGEYLMGVQSVALAGGQLLLAAQAEGLAGVWICSPLFVPTEVSRALGLPESWQAQGLILLGYPVKIPEERPRNSVDQITRRL